MQKIKDNLIKKLYQYNLARIPLILMLDLLNAADESGCVKIYYKDLVDLVGCSVAQFYNALRELEDVKLITRHRDTRYRNEIDITIRDNNFKDDYRNYVDTNKTYFTDRNYAGMKAGMIRVYLYIVFRTAKQGYKVENDRNKLYYNGSYQKIASQLHMRVRMVKKYCRALDDQGLICVKMKNDRHRTKYDIITLNKEKTIVPVIVVTEKGKIKEIKAHPMLSHWKHYIKNLCRRHDKSYDAQNLTDTALLMGQYAKQAEKQKKDIYRVLDNALLNLREYLLNSKTIHYIVRSLIDLDYTESIIAY